MPVSIRRKLLSLLILLMLVFSPGTVLAAPDDYLTSVIRLITANYPDPIGAGQLLTAALRGLFSRLDPYSEFYTPAEAEALLSDLEGSYVGIGITLLETEAAVFVTAVAPGSPAEQAGLQPGDRLLAVDGVSLAAGEQGLLYGEAGTSVHLQYRRDGVGADLETTATRSWVQENPIRSAVSPSTGYIAIERFSAPAADAFAAALTAMTRQGINRIVLDLRDNPGGDVAQAVAIARQILPAGLITTLDYTDPATADIPYYSDLSEAPCRLAVLVNARTASAAEILAGAIQDRQAGSLIGSATYGKSRFQNVFPLLTPDAYDRCQAEFGAITPDGSAVVNAYPTDLGEEDIIGWVKLTYGHYLTPSGRRLDGQGIEPDLPTGADPFWLGIHTIPDLLQVVKPTLGDISLEVYYAEKILQASGYSVSEPDGLLDLTTFRAIKAFQSDTNLFPYGVLDFTTQRTLNAHREKLRSQTDPAYYQALQVLAQDE